MSERGAVQPAGRPRLEELRRVMLVDAALLDRLFCEHGTARHLGCDRCSRRAFMVIGV